jgi:hypothetical protein
MLVNILVHYFRRQSSCHALQQPHFQTGNWNSDERIFKTNGALFTTFNQKSKDDLYIYKQTSLRNKIGNKDEQTDRQTDRHTYKNKYTKDGEQFLVDKMLDSVAKVEGRNAKIKKRKEIK